MGAVGFYFFYGFIWIITLLPLRALYLLSDFLFLLLFYFPSYRRKVVETNLRKSFPEKSEEERLVIARKFYRHLADLFVEVLKMVHMDEVELNERFKLKDPEILKRLHNEKRDIIAVLGHYNNWEMLNIFPTYTDYKAVSIYKPLHNKYFDRFLNSIRTKHGMVLTPMSLIIRELLTDRKNNVNTLSAFISDQTPAFHDIKYWTTFLNQDTPIYMGAEKIASKYDMAVMFFHIRKTSRGHYLLETELLFEHTAGLQGHMITEAHVRRLEEIIKEKPEFWIWTHKRWKHKKPQDA